jgi:hypothetical protein
VVALASFPGSGNTWVRYLLQQATGILTGSVYKDYALLKNGFPAENVVNGYATHSLLYMYHPTCTPAGFGLTTRNLSSLQVEAGSVDHSVRTKDQLFSFG